MTRHATGRLDLSVNDLERYVRGSKTGETLSLEMREAEVIEVFPDWYIREAERLSYLLAEAFEIDAIYLFGSLVWGRIWTTNTDIDLAVQGLPPEQYFKAMGFLECESSFPIDLVEINTIPDYLQRRILTEGKLLYEREPVAALGG